MKNYKSLVLIFALITGVSTLSSCKKTKVTEKDAIEFTYVEEGKDKPANGEDRKSTRLNSSHITRSRMPSSA